VNILGLYASNEESDDNQKENFYSKLCSITENINIRKEVILIGDLNARTGSKQNDSVTGPHGELVTNGNGSRLMEYCEQYGLRIMNGFFQHQNVHRYTWSHKTRQLKSIIDYVIIKHHTHFNPQDVRMYRGAECGSDYYLIIAKIYLHYRKMRNKGESENEQQITLEAPRHKIRSLQQDSIRFLYKMRVANKIATIEEGTPEQMYEELKRVLQEITYEALEQEEQYQRKTTPEWWNTDIEELVAEKKAAYNKWLMTRKVDIGKNIYIYEER